MSSKDAKSTAVMITHLMWNDFGGQPNHGGIGPNSYPSPHPVLEMPVGYGDGHVDINKKKQIKFRANIVNDFWY
jgi:hypothetical protein